MLWDPLNAWPTARRWVWASLAVLACLFQGPRFVQSLRPSHDMGVDFFQEWASGRNYFSGLPIYMDLRWAVDRHLGFNVRGDGENHVQVNLEVNPHPPTSVLLTLPLAMLSYPDAVLVWNLVSLAAFFASFWIIRRALAIPVSAWSVFPLVVLLLLCSPFRQQVLQGQLNLILLLLLTGSWAAQRSERPGWAGVLLGTATAIKLFPGFLFGYFLLRRQWKAAMAGIITLAVLTGLTVAVLGLESYKSYGTDVIPRVAVFRSCWANASLPGLWTKLFDPVAEEQVNPSVSLGPIEPLWRSQALARLGTWISCGLVITVLAWVVWGARSRVERDQAFGMTVIAMLLVSPITWGHYFLLLMLPLAIMWVRLPSSSRLRALFLVILFAVWMDQVAFYDAVIPGGKLHGTASPIHTLSVLSFQCYALLVLFALTAALSRPKSVLASLRNGEQQPLGYTDTAKRCLNVETVCNEFPCGY